MARSLQRRAIVWVVLVCVGVRTPALAETSPLEIPPTPPEFQLTEPDRPRGTILPPLLSFVIPGADQWWEGQYAWGALYTGGTATGIAYHLASQNDPDRRHRQLGLQVAGSFGGYSLYHAFQSAVTTRKPLGEYAFLKAPESPSEVWLAPLRVEYLGRWTTLLPLALAVVTAGVGYRDRDFSPRYLSLSDTYFAFGASYLAGTWEEAAFRGWMMPVFRQHLGSDFLSNLLTATLFGAAHSGRGFIPWPQALFGLYAGYVTQRNGWRIGEAVFIHTWWDVILFVAHYLHAPETASLRLPTLYFRF